MQQFWGGDDGNTWGFCSNTLIGTWIQISQYLAFFPLVGNTFIRDNVSLLQSCLFTEAISLFNVLCFFSFFPDYILPTVSTPLLFLRPLIPAGFFNLVYFLFRSLLASHCFCLISTNIAFKCQTILLKMQVLPLLTLHWNSMVAVAISPIGHILFLL